MGSQVANMGSQVANMGSQVTNMRSQVSNTRHADDVLLQVRVHTSNLIGILRQLMR